jgi:hypothetical protein
VDNFHGIVFEERDDQDDDQEDTSSMPDLVAGSDTDVSDDDVDTIIANVTAMGVGE